MSNYILTSDGELYHYGVLGMKWGKRKASYATTSPRKKRKQLEKEYGKLEDQMTYGKNADKKKNASISKKMSDIEKQMNNMDKAERKSKAKTFGKAAISAGAGAVSGLIAGNIAGKAVSSLTYGRFVPTVVAGYATAAVTTVAVTNAVANKSGLYKK